MTMRVSAVQTLTRCKNPCRLSLYAHLIDQFVQRNVVVILPGILFVGDDDIADKGFRPCSHFECVLGNGHRACPSSIVKMPPDVCLEASEQR